MLKDLNSIYLTNMFEQTDNPSDSKITFDYTDRVHQGVAIISDMARAINQKMHNSESDFTFNGFPQRIKKLVHLINAETFDFEDMEAWQMGAYMEEVFVKLQTEKNDEFHQLKNTWLQEIREGILCYEDDIHSRVRHAKDRMSKQVTDYVKSIKDQTSKKAVKIIL